MAWNGSGTYQRDNGGFVGSDVWQQDALASFDIEASRHDTHDQDLASGINNCLTKDGQNTPTANLPMGGFKHTGVTTASARDQYLTYGQAQDSAATWAGTSGGSANAQTLTLTPALTAYATGQRFAFTVGGGLTNTGATTLNINGLGVKDVFSRHNTSALIANALIAGLTYEVIYDGTQFLLMDPYSTWISFTPTLTQTATITTSTVESRYMITNSNLLTWECYVSCDSAGTAAGAVQISTPINSAGANLNRTFGVARFWDASAAANYILGVSRLGLDQFRFYHDTSATNPFGNSPAVTIASGDWLAFTVTYRI